MNDTQLKTIEEIKNFLAGTGSITFSFQSRDDRYAWIEKTLVRFKYLSLNKGDKGVVIQYLMKVTDYSRQQLTRLIRQYRTAGRVRRRQGAHHCFPVRYTDADMALLVEVDTLHNTLSGPATKKIIARAYKLYGNKNYERLASISVSHLYNLRKAAGYKRRRQFFTKTKSAQVKYGQRRKPDPEGKPGYIRIDTVHQGDLDGKKGVYHINAVDEVTQFEVISAVERISEAYLLPVIKALLEAFPFSIRGFHSDNGSEFVNKNVARLLNKLLIKFTKSRSRQTNDNALVESKNASIVRKQFGYAHIPQKHAALINQFNRDYLNPYINFHRPCFFPEIILDKKGKEKKRYRYEKMMTPYEKFKSLKKAETYLKKGLTLKQLDEFALEISDNEAARRLTRAKDLLFKKIDEQEAA